MPAPPAHRWRYRAISSACRSASRRWTISSRTSNRRWAERAAQVGRARQGENAMLGGSGGWVGATAKEISRAVRRGDASATQVLADHLDYIRRHDEIVGAFRLIRPEAVAEAEAVDEQEDLANLPLAGVPIAVKENTALAGLPTWSGSAAARTGVAEADHEVVRRLRGAGAVVV